MRSISNSAKLLEIEPNIQDRQLSLMIAAALLETDRRPYWFSINHDVRPPKCLACPLHYDWAVKDRVGIKTFDRERARKWIVQAAMLGFSIAREGGKPLTSSMEIARRRAEFHRALRENNDDIPF